MTLNEKKIVQLLFKNKIYEKNAYEFQNFFTKIITKYDKDFVPIKPHGVEGDMKNDGYNPKTGEYYQVYGPEKTDEKSIIEKMTEDLKGLYQQWNDECPIKKYFFVLNDKYLGIYPNVSKAMDNLKTKYAIDGKILLAKDLENMLFELNDEEISDILGIFSVPELQKFSFNDLNEVVEFIMKMDYNEENESITIPAEMEEKIKFNNLNEEIEQILNKYSIYTGQLEKYFSNKGNFEREKIQKKLIEIYQESKEYITEDIDDYNSIRFMYIRNKISPNKKDTSIIMAVYVLMSYYFETCDIMENPNKEENI